MTTSGYRYGFNGKEKDGPGIGGGGSTYDYGFRIYNPNLGKFLSVDPISREYPWYSPYHFAGNTPIQAIDVDGLEPQKVIEKAHEYLYTLYEWGGKNPDPNTKGMLRNLSKEHVAWYLENVTSKIKQAYTIAFTTKRGKYVYSEVERNAAHEVLDEIYYYLIEYYYDNVYNSIGLDCSGLARLAFNEDREKLMPDFSPYEASASVMMNAFVKAKENNTGNLHFEPNLILKGDLVFLNPSKPKDGDWSTKHVMIATGNVKRGLLSRNVTKFEVIESVGSFGVKYSWYKVGGKNRYAFGHTFRTTDAMKMEKTGDRAIDDFFQGLRNLFRKGKGEQKVIEYEKE